MISSYFNITIIAEWICFIAALILLHKKTKVWRLFILLLFLTLCAETTGWYMRTRHHQFHNALPFNFLMIISTTFLIWFFTKAASLQKMKKVLNYLNYFFILFAVINLFFFQGFWKYNSFSETLGDIMLAIICCYFFYTLLTEKNYVDLLRLDYFWLATGIFFSALGSALLYQFSGVLRDYYLRSKIDIGTYINYSLNLILYISLIIAFICRWKTTR
ncbi:MAG: hypothetical protein JWO92_704 [Chitinophagaceae bacterium]|nr:hypothetical protein [Chitinophagaceae bacterium]